MVPYSYREQITLKENLQLTLSIGNQNDHKLLKQSYGLCYRNSSFKCSKKIFSDVFSRKDLEIIWKEMQIQQEKTLVGNIYIPSGNENYLHILDIELEKHKGESILLIGDFNSRNQIWDRNANNNSRMGLILEDIINRHGL